MGTVLLHSVVGPFEFRRREMVRHESGNQYLAPVTYRFGFENGFRTTVPSNVWESLRDEYVDAKNHIRYGDILRPL